jgi:hypothetical protein
MLTLFDYNTKEVTSTGKWMIKEKQTRIRSNTPFQKFEWKKFLYLEVTDNYDNPRWACENELKFIEVYQC